MIYRLGSLGDTVVALPCFHKIAETFPAARRLVVTNVPVSTNVAPLETILRPGGFIHGTIAYPAGTRAPAELVRLVFQLRSLRARTLVFLGGGRGLGRTRRDVLMFRACGFTQIIGAPLTEDLEKSRVDADGFLEPEAERLARCLEELGPIDLHDRSLWDLNLTGEELRAGALAIAPLQGRPVLAVNMGGKVQAKGWGEANWSQVLSWASRRGDLGLVVVGGDEDRDPADRIIRSWQGPALNTCGWLSARETAALLSKVQAFAGHDSGPLHLAAAMNVRCVGIYGFYNRPRRWHPYGPGHVVLHDMRGVAAISPEQVQAALTTIGWPA